jgi:hypothetical protein
MAERITEFEGLQVIPPLYRTPEGWAEERPAACACGEERFLIGWAACACRTDTLAPGHRTWGVLGVQPAHRTGVPGVGRARPDAELRLPHRPHAGGVARGHVPAGTAWDRGKWGAGGAVPDVERPRLSWIGCRSQPGPGLVVPRGRG